MTAPADPTTAEGRARLLQLSLRRNVAAYPLENFSVLRYGAYGAVRHSASEGACGPKPGEPMNPGSADEEARIRAARYPCTHYGVDLSAPQGTRVVAPHDGWVLYWGPANDAPFVGYSPWVILIAHDDVRDPLWDRIKKQANEPLIANWHPTAQSARYSLIGHLAPMPGVSPRIPMSDFMFKTDDKKRWRRLKDGTIVMTFEPHPDRYIYTGDDIGTVSDRNHVHWEIRTSPLAGKSGRIDPMELWRTSYKVPTPDGVVLPPPPKEGGGIGMLLLALALGSSTKKRSGGRRRR
jgi:murein DD-endopeptidase MepM/ murein hydrolase activator NlpD